MKVLFIQNIKNVAQIGDIKEVSSGYARNFLFPRKLAKPVTLDIDKEVQALKQKRDIELNKSKREAEEIAKRLEGASVEISEGANTEGHLYGSVDAKKIALEMEKQLHIKLGPDTIELPHHLKTTGEHQISINLGYTIATTLTVRVRPS